VNAPNTTAMNPTPVRPAAKQPLRIARLRPRFLVPTVASIAMQMTSVLTLVMLLLLMISARPGDGGNDGGGSGNGSSGQDGQGEFAVAATGSGSQTNINAAGDAASAVQPVDAAESERSASAPRANSQRPPQNAGFPLAAQAENRKKFFVMPDFPAPAANLEPAGAGGGDGFSDLEDRLRRAGAQTGDVQISLAWNNGNDLDLHVETPGGEKIFFNQRDSSCGGQLDVDMNAAGAESQTPVENVFWPTGGSPTGRYRVLVHHYANHGSRDPTRYQITIKIKGEAKKYNGSVKDGDPLQMVNEFEVD
jgi:hypothetical protein